MSIHLLGGYDINFVSIIHIHPNGPGLGSTLMGSILIVSNLSSFQVGYVISLILTVFFQLLF